MSLTVNQAVLAIQFPDVWGWVKENPKKSFAIAWVAFGMTLVVKHILAERREAQAVDRIRNSSPKTTPALPVQHAQFESDAAYTFTTYAAGWTFYNPRNEPRLVPDAQDWQKLTDAEKVESSKQWQGKWIDWHGPILGGETYVTVARDRENKITGAVFYQALRADSRVLIRNLQGNSDFVKVALRRQLVKKGNDIFAVYGPEDATYSDLEAEIVMDDQMQPVKERMRSVIEHGKPGMVFERSNARTRRLLEGGRDRSGAEVKASQV